MGFSVKMVFLGYMFRMYPQIHVIFMDLPLKKNHPASLEYPHDLGKHHSGFKELDQWKKISSGNDGFPP
jgi:hypothetical protein